MWLLSNCNQPIRQLGPISEALPQADGEQRSEQGRVGDVPSQTQHSRHKQRGTACNPQRAIRFAAPTAILVLILPHGCSRARWCLRFRPSIYL